MPTVPTPANRTTHRPTARPIARLIRRPARGAAAVAALGLTAVASVASVGGVARAAGSSVAPGTTVLSREVVAQVAGATVLHQVADRSPMRVAVAMTANQAARDAAYAAMYDPKSPSYHAFLTPAEFNAEFGVSAAAAARVRQSVTAKGLSVAYGNPDGSYLLLTGTAKQVEQTFAVTENAYQGTDGKLFTANAQAPTVPAGVSSVLGLNSLATFTTAAAQAHPAAAPAVAPAQTECEQVACLGTLSPQDLWSVYSEPSSDRGAGQKVAIFGEGQITPVVSNLRVFEKNMGFPQVPVRRVNVGDDLSDNAGETEWDLDSDASTGMSPDLQEIAYYFGSDLSDASIGGTYSAWANDPAGANTGNSSFGGPEVLEYDSGFALDTFLQQAAMEGRTMFASAGDGGSSCLPGANGATNDGVPCVEYPASSPYVTGVGGTVLYTTVVAGKASNPAVRSNEYSWTYSGGGMSMYEGAAPGQAAAYPMGDSTAVVCVAGASLGKTCRGVPDVSSLSGDITTNDYPIVSGNGSSGTEGGTSLSSPLWAGMWARVQAAHPATCTGAGSRGVAGTPGFAQPLLYNLGNTTATDAASFFDIGDATNKSIPAGNGSQNALPRSPADPTGYDFVSGLGTPILSGIINTIDCGNTTPVAANVVPASNDVSTVPNDPACVNGVLSPDDPTGDVVSGTAAEDLIKGRITSTTTSTTFSTTVSNLALGAGNDLDYAFEFSYGGGAYAAVADGDPTTGVTYSLYQLFITVTPIGLGVESQPTLLSSALTGTYTAATNTISVTMPWSVFNSTAKTTPVFGPGSVVSGLHTYTNVGPAMAGLDNDYDSEPADQALYGDCSYVVPGAVAVNPTPTLPEAPVAVLIPLAALGLVGGVAVTRRRRRA